MSAPLTGILSEADHPEIYDSCVYVAGTNLSEKSVITVGWLFHISLLNLRIDFSEPDLIFNMISANPSCQDSRSIFPI